jgi:murein DD-endopeptidase MepM/ murein hydrolase activator NlpD
MSIAAMALASLLASQGQAVQISVPAEPNLQQAHVVWDDRVIPMVRAGERWLTVVGVDLDMPAGDYDVPIALTFESGERRTESEQIAVREGNYPTTELSVAQRYVELNAEDQARAARESREIADLYATLTEERFWIEPFQVPIPGTTGGRNFGHRRIFNGQARAPHSGADLRAATGTPILSANRGRVVLAKELFFSGNAVFIDHGLGVYSVYLHLSDIQVGLGTMVEKGQILGLAGATGRVTGPHLHWGVRILDARIDPFTLLQLERD